MTIPHSFERILSRIIFKKQAKEIFDWLQSNSNTVIVDEMLIAIRKRRDWKEGDER